MFGTDPSAFGARGSEHTKCPSTPRIRTRATLFFWGASAMTKIDIVRRERERERETERQQSRRPDRSNPGRCDEDAKGGVFKMNFFIPKYFSEKKEY